MDNSKPRYWPMLGIFGRPRPANRAAEIEQALERQIEDLEKKVDQLQKELNKRNKVRDRKVCASKNPPSDNPHTLEEMEIALSRWSTGGIAAARRLGRARPFLLKAAVEDLSEIRAWRNLRPGQQYGELVQPAGRRHPPCLPTDEQIAAATSRCPSGIVHDSIRTPDGILWLWGYGGYWPAATLGAPGTLPDSRNPEV